MVPARDRGAPPRDGVPEVAGSGPFAAAPVPPADELLGVTKQEARPQPAPPPPPNCGLRLSQSDLQQPIKKVGRHRGFCFYASTASWVRECAVARLDKDYVKYAMAKGVAYQRALSPVVPYAYGGTPPVPVTVRYAGGMRTLTTQLRTWPLEDVYCAANGWMNLPSHVVTNRTELEKVASLHCQALFTEHPEFTAMSMREVLVLTAKNAQELAWSALGKSLGPTIADLKGHAISRCLLGGLECDIANCAMNFCPRDDLGPHVIGHTSTQCSITKLQE